jgi:hypothetical protein
LSVNLVISWRLDGHNLLVMVFSIQVLKWNRTDWSVWIILLESSVGDERRDILFKLGKIRNNVVLSEVNVALVVHLVSNDKEELALFEHINHVGNRILHLHEAILLSFRIVLSLADFFLEHLNLILKTVFQVLFLGITKLAS